MAQYYANLLISSALCVRVCVAYAAVVYVAVVFLVVRRPTLREFLLFMELNEQSTRELV